MKKLRNVLTLLLVLTMLFSLVACGSPAATAGPTTAGPTTAGPTTDGTTVPTKTGVLKIGSLAHTTGWFAAIDLNNTYEIDSYVKIINEEGGVVIGDTTYTIELTQADAASSNEGVRAGAIALADAGCEYVIETNDFWVVNCQDVFEGDGIFHISAYCVGFPGYLGPDFPYAFTGANGTYGDFRAAMMAIKENYPDVKSLVLCNDDNGGLPGMQHVLEVLGEEMGIDVLDDYIPYTGDTIDMTSIATKLVASGADCAFTSGSLATVGGVLKEIRNQGSDMVVAASIGQPAQALMRISGEDAADRAFTIGNPLTAEDNTEIWSKLYNRVVADYGAEVAATFTGNYANCLHEILDVMKKCGSVDVDTVKAAWEASETVDTLYGPGILGGDTLYGINNHAVANVTPVSMLVKGKVEFKGWLEVEIP